MICRANKFFFATIFFQCDKVTWMWSRHSWYSVLWSGGRFTPCPLCRKLFVMVEPDETTFHISSNSVAENV